MDVISRLRRAGTAAPLATVSGVATTNTEMIAWFDRHTDVAVVTTKSIQRVANPGNREPILTEPSPGSFGNAVGLKNPGIAAAVTELQALRARGALRAMINVSVSADSAPDFVALAKAAAPVADLLELNYSCPHAAAGFGADIGRDETAIAEITRAVVEAVPDTPVLVKLTPNVPDTAGMAAVAVAAGAAGIAAINTVGPEVYRHPDTNTPILSNPPDGRGGKSGAWIRDRALEAIAEIRQRIGPTPLILGMGGVSTHADVAAMRAAGADVVGIGSALAAVPQRDWPGYLRSLSAGGVLSTTRTGPAAAMQATSALAPAAAMQATSALALAALRPAAPAPAAMTLSPYRVRERRELGDDLFELELTEPVGYGPGQTVFLWLPGVGEKPFSPAIGTPGTFLIRRRGPVTRALGDLEPGDTVFLRGPYGTVHHPPAHTRVLLVGAGSGAAVLPALAAAITSRGGSVATVVGVRSPLVRGAVELALAAAGPVRYVADEGVVGRVLEDLVSAAHEMAAERVYVVGPDPFMKAAVSLLAGRSDLTSDDLFVSVEQPMRCGVGLCGECHVNGWLTCHSGTIVSAPEVAG